MDGWLGAYRHHPAVADASVDAGFSPAPFYRGDFKVVRLPSVRPLKRCNCL